MLSIRRGRVVAIRSAGDRLAEIDVDVGGERRPAVALVGLTGAVAEGDDVLVNVEALDLGLGSGGFDVVHANLTRGMDAPSPPGAHVMKLNYSPLQHSVTLVEEGLLDTAPVGALTVGVLALHGQLAAAAHALAATAPGVEVGYVQTAGGALPGALSRTVGELRRRRLLAGHVTVGPCFGGEHESATVAAALAAVEARLGWKAALVGPGPGIQGSGSGLGHGGLAALDSAHAALALGLETVLVPRLSGGDPRPRHLGLSHHSEAVLRLLLRPVTVAVPHDLGPGREAIESAIQMADPGRRHRYEQVATGELVAGYRASGLPADTMGRSLDDDAEFFAAGLAGGAVVGARALEASGRKGR